MDSPVFWIIGAIVVIFALPISVARLLKATLAEIIISYLLLVTFLWFLLRIDSHPFEETFSWVMLFLFVLSLFMIPLLVLLVRGLMRTAILICGSAKDRDN